MMVPFYGRRRAPGQLSSKLLTVADYQLQNLAVIAEGVALLRWLHKTYPEIPLGVTGLSWGGAMAACIGVVCQLPVACIPCLSTTSPAVMVTGCIHWQLDWSKLMDEHDHTLDEAMSALENEFRSITLQTLVDTAPAPRLPTISSLVQLNAYSDYYVDASEGQALYDAIQPACKSHALVWVDGGHVTSFVSAGGDILSAVVRAYDSLDAT